MMRVEGEYVKKEVQGRLLLRIVGMGRRKRVMVAGKRRRN